jgi:hypothetical protein
MDFLTRCGAHIVDVQPLSVQPLFSKGYPVMNTDYCTHRSMRIDFWI